jgi:hypothetical protein
MSMNPLARHYDRLRPEERFRLILAAGARGDEAEQDRLVNAAPTKTFSTTDHAPFARAFDELATLVFIELVEEAARYHDFLAHAGEAEEERDATAGAKPEDGDRRKRPLWQRTRDLARAAGFVLRTKAEGWKRFCERLSVPPFAVCRLYPGLDRLQSALALADEGAFAPEGMVRWLNGIRPTGKPKVTEADVMTAEGIADSLEAAFRQGVQWWGG